MKLPDPRRLGGEIDVDPRQLSEGLAETFRQWAADWARLGVEAPFRAGLSGQLFALAERAQHVDLERLAGELRKLAADAERMHRRGRAAAWDVLTGDEVAA